MDVSQIDAAIKMVKRLGGRPPVVLVRYRKALLALAFWRRKRKLAETKVKKYLTAVRRYEKKVGTAQ